MLIINPAAPHCFLCDQSILLSLLLSRCLLSWSIVLPPLFLPLTKSSSSLPLTILITSLLSPPPPLPLSAPPLKLSLTSSLCPPQPPVTSPPLSSPHPPISRPLPLSTTTSDSPPTVCLSDGTRPPSRLISHSRHQSSILCLSLLPLIVREGRRRKGTEGALEE